MDQDRKPWEPDPARVGKNWTAMFDEPARGGATATPREPPTLPEADPFDDADVAPIDLADYKPWVLQRGRPAALLELRRYEPKSGLWRGWMVAWPSLLAVDYTGPNMVSLDFGSRQFVVKGTGLEELTRHLQQASVRSIIEYSSRIWHAAPSTGAVTSIELIQ